MTLSNELSNKTISEKAPSNPTTNPSAPVFLPTSTSGTKIPAPSIEDRTAPSAVGVTSASAASQTTPSVTVRPNALSDLASYNYILEFKATDIQGLKNLQTSQRYRPEDWVTLISSTGGLSGVKSLRDSSDNTVYFDKEYYIDNFELESIVGVNADATSGPDCMIKFTVSEPYGINFIQDLWDFNTYGLQNRNYLETCYMMVVSWKGFDDQGKLSKLDIVKYIPMRLAKIDIKLTSAGAEYSVEAIPFNHLTNQKKYGLLTSSAELEGTLISELILGKGKSQTATGDQKNLRYILNEEPKKVAEKTASEPGIFNPTIYEFEFETVGNVNIGTSALAAAADIDVKDTSMDFKDVSQDDQQLLQSMKSYQLLSRSTPKIAREKTIVKFNKGSQITEILNQLIVNSTYITNQVKKYREDVKNALAVKDPKEREQAIKSLERSLNWFRIIPKVEVTGVYSKVDNVEQKKITYYIRPFEIQDTRGIAGSVIGAADPSKFVVKEYFYFFTGKNTEIINVDLSFNSSMYTFRTSNTTVSQLGSNSKAVEDRTKNGAVNNPINSTDQAQDPINAGKMSHSVPFQGAKNVGVATVDRNSGNEVANTLYSNIDLIQMDLEIMGDPDLIKQDSIMYSVYTGTNASDIPIPFDKGERYIRVLFVSPKDIDESTGMIIGLKNSDTLFNGIYALIGITSFFKQGKFTQILKLRKVISIPQKQTPKPKQSNG